MTDDVKLAGIQLVSVFAAGPGGGNPAPVMVDARGLSDTEMRYRQRYVDLIVNEHSREIFRTRSRIVDFSLWAGR